LKNQDSTVAISENSLMRISFIKARAEDELARRQASNVQHSEDFYHPWSLPKGNFKHRMLSTGLVLIHIFSCIMMFFKNIPFILKIMAMVSLNDLQNYLHGFSRFTTQQFIYCIVPENIHASPHRRDWNFLGVGGGGFHGTKTFKEVYQA